MPAYPGRRGVIALQHWTSVDITLLNSPSFAQEPVNNIEFRLYQLVVILAPGISGDSAAILLNSIALKIIKSQDDDALGPGQDLLRITTLLSIA